MIYLPKEKLYTLNFFTAGHDAPVVIASYSPEEQKQIDQLSNKIKEDQNALLYWCQQNKFRNQVILKLRMYS